MDQGSAVQQFDGCGDGLREFGIIHPACTRDSQAQLRADAGTRREDGMPYRRREPWRVARRAGWRERPGQRDLDAGKG
jgi:hypothetical protein